MHIRRVSSKYAARTALEYGYRKFTYAEFMDKIDEVALAWESLGVEKGDKVIMLMGHNPMNIINWINDNLADYIRPDFMEKWFVPIKNELLSKPQSNSVDVRRQLISAAKIVDNFVFSKN